MAQVPHTENFVDLAFPIAGIDRSMGFENQPNRPGPGGRYYRTTYLGRNVRGYEHSTGRRRGGRRGGMSKWLSAAPVEDWIVQELSSLVGTGYDPPGGGAVQASQSGRIVTLVAVAQGNLFVANSGDTTWTEPTNNTGETPPLNYTGIIFSAPNNQKLYFVDGINYVYYDPFLNTVESWTATAGELPEDEDGNYATLICTWRGRTVLSGIDLDPQNWFMSAVSDPHDFDYSPTSITPTQAIAGGNAPQGLIGDLITSLVPYSDDVLIFGGDHTIYMMRGDPMLGGQIDLISDSIGMAWGQAWCRDPYGTLYFFSNKNGIYSLTPGQAPLRISQGIERLLEDIDTGENVIRLLWNDRAQGFHTFVTPSDEPTATTHFFFEARTGAWWTDSFADENMNPLCCCTFDGNEANDRVALIGSWDGYVRAIDPEAEDDDGEDIASEVWIGPLGTKDLDDVLLKRIQGVLAENSGRVDFAVHAGATAEIALNSDPVSTGTWTAGRNLSNMIRRADHAIYIKLTSTSSWAMESIVAVVDTKGRVRRRGA